VFGPTRAAARLETSKQYAKTVMERAGVPTAAWAAFTDEERAIAHLGASPGPYVVKADGLAAGKGVLVTADLDAAKAWVHTCLEGGFGGAGRTVVIEERLSGDEVSVFTLTAAGDSVALEPARDYKRLRDGGLGPNTGGMGSFSPVRDFPDGLVAGTVSSVVEPVLATLADDGIPYTGFLYAGLMVDGDRVDVLEFNCRLGDPETQAVLPRLESDFLDLLEAGARGALPGGSLQWNNRAAVDVVLAAPGYPEAPERGSQITGLEALADRDDALVFHAGTARTEEGLVTAGGRVLNVVGLGTTLAEARASAYDAAMTIDFSGKQMRMDIAG
jgi:phosphoribosylamine--glycine ligase